MAKTALIFGISGQDGAYLTSFLLERGYKVVGASRDAQLGTFANLERLGVRNKVQLVSVSPRDFRSVFQALHQISPDEVYNLAGQSSVGLSFEQPVETLESISLATLNMLEAIRLLDKPVRIYNAGSSECFGDASVACDEETAFRPRSPYAMAKAAAFWEVANYREAYRLHACSGIVFNHESPLRPERFVTQKIVYSACRIAEGQQKVLKLGDLSIQRDWGWAPEYVDAMWRMLQEDAPTDYVIATGETNSLEQLVAEAFRLVGLDWTQYVEIDRSLFRPTELRVGRGNAAKVRQRLGWTANVRMREVVSRMVEAALKHIRISKS